jgi:hypothetical protein
MTSSLTTRGSNQYNLRKGWLAAASHFPWSPRTLLWKEAPREPALVRLATSEKANRRPSAYGGQMADGRVAPAKTIFKCGRKAEIVLV